MIDEKNSEWKSFAKNSIRSSQEMLNQVSQRDFLRTKCQRPLSKIPDIRTGHSAHHQMLMINRFIYLFTFSSTSFNHSFEMIKECSVRHHAIHHIEYFSSFHFILWLTGICQSAYSILEGKKSSSENFDLRFLFDWIFATTDDRRWCLSENQLLPVLFYLWFQPFSPISTWYDLRDK